MLYWVWLRLRTPAASPLPRRLLIRFGSPKAVYCAAREDYATIEGITAGQIEELCKKGTDTAAQILEYCGQQRIGILTYGDKHYPESLRQLLNPPILLFYMGKLPDFNRAPMISVVGMRAMSDYGKRMAYATAFGLARAKTIVVSGMALGIDGVAAAGAIAAGGKTVAVLGNGFGRVYPPEHGRLLAEIVRHGAVLTEYVPGAEPAASNFPQRNRIISMLGSAVAVVEAGERSGALITARIAMEQGRPVFVLPGNADSPNSVGTNYLAKTGARVFTGAYDILDGTGRSAEAALVPKAISPTADEMISKLGVAAKAAAVPEEKKTKNASPLPRSAEKAAEKHPEVKLPAKKAEVDISALEAQFGKSVADLFQKIPAEGDISAEDLCEGCDEAEMVVGYLTLLEIRNLVERLPGGRFRRVH